MEIKGEYTPKTLEEAIKEIRRLEALNEERYRVEKIIIAAGLLNEEKFDQAREIVRKF